MNSKSKYGTRLTILFFKTFVFFLFAVKRNIRQGEDEEIKMKEQAILNLGTLLAKHGKAGGKLPFQSMSHL